MYYKIIKLARSTENNSLNFLAYMVAQKSCVKLKFLVEN
jgi:hypothetical protein